MSSNQGQIQKILNEGLRLGNTNLTCLPILLLKLICDTGYRNFGVLVSRIMARPWQTVIIDFKRTSSFKKNNKKNPQTNGRAVTVVPVVIVETLAIFFLWIPLQCWFWRCLFPTKRVKPTLQEGEGSNTCIHEMTKFILCFFGSV